VRFVDENDCIGGISRPIVVLVECDIKVFNYLGGNSPFNHQIYGDRAHFNQIPDTRSYYTARDWALDPEKPESMLQMLADHPKFTLPRLEAWLASNSFVVAARRRLIQSMSEHGGGGSEWSMGKFNKRWASRVKQVVFAPHVNTDSPYLRRVFLDWFPNAKFAQHTGERENMGAPFQGFRDIWNEPQPLTEPVEHFSGWVGFGEGDEEEE
jgi:hypothetical protein